MRKLDNKGVTLVELVLGILILGICAIMLATCFSGALSIINRATLYKMESSTAASSIELEEKQETESDDYSVTGLKYKSIPAEGIQLTYKENGVSKTSMIQGQYLIATVEGTSDTKLSYKEFLSSNISFNVNAEDAE